jgi:large conductance mechanosensitive channel
MATRSVKSSKRAAASASPRVGRTISAEPPVPQYPPLHVPKPFAGFIYFVRTQGVVGIGIAFVVGMAANTLIKSIVTNMINPIVGLAIGGISLSQKTVCLNSVNHVCKNTFNYGQVISDFITFLVILFVVYVIINSLKLDKLDKKKDA